MIKPDEIQFAELCLAKVRCNDSRKAYSREGCWPRDLILAEACPIHHKRAWHILQKWTDRDWYEYGVTLDLGWLTAKGIEGLTAMVAKAKVVVPV